METRKRNKRGDAPAAPITSTRTRGAARNDGAGAQEAETNTEVVVSLPPPPRRSAPKGRAPAASVASIPTQHERDSDDGEEEEDDEEAEASGPEDEQAGDEIETEGAQVEQQVALETAEAAAAEDEEGEGYRRKLMHSMIPDLEYASRELCKTLNTSAERDQVYRSRLRFKKSHLFSLRELYQDADSPSLALIDLNVAQEKDLGAGARQVLFRANLAIVLDGVDQFLHDPKYEHLDFFEVLDRYAADRLFVSKEYLEHVAKLALDIRTQLVITRYASSRSITVNKLLNDAFLQEDQDGGEDSPLLEDGNIRSLGSEDREREADLCSERINKLAAIFKELKNKKPAVLKKLKTEFPVETCIETLRYWLLGQNELLDARGQEVDIFQDAREDPDESVAESQTITRMAPGQMG